MPRRNYWARGKSILFNIVYYAVFFVLYYFWDSGVTANKKRYYIIAKVLGNEGKYFSSDGQRVYAQSFIGGEILPKHLVFWYLGFLPAWFFVGFYFLPHPMHSCY